MGFHPHSLTAVGAAFGNGRFKDPGVAAQQGALFAFAQSQGFHGGIVACDVNVGRWGARTAAWRYVFAHAIDPEGQVSGDECAHSGMEFVRGKPFDAHNWLCPRDRNGALPSGSYLGSHYAVQQTRR